MAWSLIAKTSAAGLSNPTTPAINTTGANLILFAMSATVSPSPGMQDSANNTWHTAGTSLSGNFQWGLFYAFNPTTSNSHTFELTGTDIEGALAVLAYSGATTTNPLDQGDSTSGSGLTISIGPITPTENGELIVASAHNQNVGTTLSVNSGMTVQEFVDAVGSTNFGVGIATFVQTTAAMIDPTFTFGSTQTSPSGAAIGSFEVPPSGGPPGPTGFIGTRIGQIGMI